jgi:predicted regulator of Ras-like GTPase activity (Roadblock/LC7/MglB family)
LRDAKQLEELCRSLVARSRGSIVSAMVVDEEGSVRAHNPVTELDEDMAAVAVGATAAFRYMSEARGYPPPHSIDVEMRAEGARMRLRIRPLGSGLILVVKTSRQPNLGLVDLLMEQL